MTETLRSWASTGGGSAWCIANYLSDRPLHLFDTFQGLPDKSVSGDSVPGLFEAPIDEVKAFLADFGNVSFHQGLFEDTHGDVADRRFSFVHLDADIYETQRLGLEFFYPRMQSGGIILLDDYGSDRWTGTKRAADAFCEKTRISLPEVTVADEAARYFQAVLVVD